MRIVTLPGVFAPISDSRMLAAALRAEIARRPGRVTTLDLCTGSGLMAVTAAKAGARQACAVDVSRRAVLCTRLNGLLNGVQVTAARGDLFAPFDGRAFDVITANPPYVPCDRDELPTSGLERAWDAGRDGRVVLDRVIDEAPEHLAPGGALLLTHSTIIGEQATLERLRDRGLEPEVVVREPGELGPLMRARLDHLIAEGMVDPDDPHNEEVLVIRGCKPRTASRWRRPSSSAGESLAAAGRS